MLQPALALGAAFAYHAVLMSSPAPRPPIIKAQHLLAVSDLSVFEITALLDLAASYAEANRNADKRHAILAGATQVNLFFENSTRTQSSFEIAGKRLGCNMCLTQIQHTLQNEACGQLIHVFITFGAR